MHCSHHDVAENNAQLALNNNHTIMSSKNTKEKIKGRKSKKDIQYNGQKKRHKGTNNYLHSTTQRTKD